MKRKLLRRVAHYLRPYRWRLCFTMCFALGQVLLFLLVPVLIGEAINSMIGVGSVEFSAIFPILLGAGVAILLGGGAQWVMQILARKISADVAQDIRQNAFDHLGKVPLKELDNRKRGDLASRLVNDADAVAEGLLQTISQLFPGVVTIITTLAVMFVLNWAIALVVLLATPLSVLFARFAGKRTARYFRGMMDEQGRLSAFVGEMVHEQGVVKDFGYEQQAQHQFEQQNKKYATQYRKAVFYSSIINPGTRFVNVLVFAAVAVLGGMYAIAGGITVGGLSVFLNYANQYTKPFNEVTAVLTQVQTAMAGAERLFEMIDLVPEKEDCIDAFVPTHVQGVVQAKNVSFSYEKNRPLLQDISFLATSGKRIALVGSTGCGKTTLINLLMRFYEVDAGEISVDGHAIDSIQRSTLRKLYGMVLQETWLKQATVRDNIAYGVPNASDEEVIQAAKQALAHGFITRLPHGYNTVLKAGGEGLSAGEKQLLCIARIVLAKPELLILDEATSSIDTRTEILIQQAMEKLMKGHTSFVVAHRLSTIQNADEILVMDAGRITERGTHAQLVEKNGFYTRLYNSQFGGEAANAF